MDYISDFVAAIQAAGFTPNEPPIADDKPHRLKVDGERKSSFSYQLAIDGDSAVGWFHSFKDGVTHKYLSRANNKGMSDAERDELKRKRQEQRKRRDKEIADKHDAAAITARTLWGSIKPANGACPYSKRKGINPVSARWFDGGEVYGFSSKLNACLVVPVYKGGKIVNLQFISDDFKLFLPNAELAGGYGAISHAPPDGVIWVAEGYATAATVAKALGVTVAIAFNAGNLKAVCDTMADKYPSCAVHIAADNDHATESAGKGNAGISKAKESGYQYSAPASEDGVTDWNDYYMKHGLEATREAIEHGLGLQQRQDGSISPEAPIGDMLQPVIEEDPDAWMEKLRYNDKGGLDKNSLNNIALYLRHHHSFKAQFWYDAFFRQVMVRHEGDVQPISDEFVMNICLEAEMIGLGKNYDMLNKLIVMVAKERPINPAKMYFDKLAWDGTPRLDTWLSYYMGAEDEPAEYLAFIGKKWLTAAVKRVYEAGCKFDHVLVIEGGQGLGKSTALKTLATFGDESRCYCTDSFSFSDIDDKDSIRKTNGNIIIELAEMVGHNKKETEEIKRWITMQEDIARFAYSRHEQRFPRMFVLASTTNSYEYLNDPTENRRYWPFKAKGIDMDAIKRDRAQLWAEAVHCYKNKLYIGPTPEESELAKVEQRKRLEVDPWTEDVERVLMDLKHRTFTTGEVMQSLSLTIRDRDRLAKRRITSILSSLGYEYKSRWDSMTGKSIKSWGIAE